MLGAHQIERFLIGEDVAAGLARIARLAVEPVEEEQHRHLHRRCDIPYTACADAIGSGLVLLDLLVRDANTVAKLLRGHSQQRTALAYPLPDTNIYCVLHLSVVPVSPVIGPS